MTSGRIDRIRARLLQRFEPAKLEIRDDSALHAGHAGARDGAGHYAVSIQSDAFRGLGKLERHRLVYQALDEMMPGEIHALSIDAVAPGDD